MKWFVVSSLLLFSVLGCGVQGGATGSNPFARCRGAYLVRWTDGDAVNEFSAALSSDGAFVGSYTTSWGDLVSLDGIVYGDGVVSGTITNITTGEESAFTGTMDLYGCVGSGAFWGGTWVAERVD